MSLFSQSALVSGIGANGQASSLVLTVRTKSDFPAPVGGVITTPVNKTVIVIENIDLGTDRLVIGSGGSITGIRRNGGAATIISGTTTGALVTIANSGDYIDVGFNQLGSGDVVNVDGVAGGGGTQLLFTRVSFKGKIFRITDAFFSSFITCEFTEGSGLVLSSGSNVTFIGVKETSLFIDQADGDVGILLEGTATLERLLVDTTAFVRSFISKGIVIENGANLDFLQILDVGFNLFNPGATGIELANPDAIIRGLLRNAEFELGAIPFASSPVLDSSITVFNNDLMILNGNLWIVTGSGNTFTKFVGISNTVDTVFTFGTNLTAITNDGVNVIVGDDSTNLISVMVGESDTLNFSFATPGSAIAGLAFDGQDLWLTDIGTDLVYQLDRKSAVIKQSWATISGFPRGIDLDGTVVMVADNATDRVDVHKPDGTFLYAFLTNVPGMSTAGIAHQENQYVIGDPGNGEVHIFNKNIAFHEGSKNWVFDENNTISPSATRIVSRFSSVGTTVTPALVNEWTDIQDAGLTLIWGAAAEGFEKLLVTNVINGTVKYVGEREISDSISASLQLARSGGSNINIQISIFLNGVVIGASIFSLALDTNNTFTPTLPSFILKMKQGDEIVLRFRNITNTNAVDFFNGTLSA